MFRRIIPFTNLDRKMNEAIKTQNEQTHNQFLQEYNELLLKFDCSLVTTEDSPELEVIFNYKGIENLMLS